MLIKMCVKCQIKLSQKTRTVAFLLDHFLFKLPTQQARDKPYIPYSPRFAPLTLRFEGRASKIDTKQPQARSRHPHNISQLKEKTQIRKFHSRTYDSVTVSFALLPMPEHPPEGAFRVGSTP